MDLQLPAVISQWLELKTHFDVTSMCERCYTAEILTELFKDEKNLAVLLFLHPFLFEVQRVNKLFEIKVVDKMKLLDDLTHLRKSIANKLINPSSRFDYRNSNTKEFLNPPPYLRYRYEKKIRDLSEDNKLSKQEKKVLRDRCQKFLLSLYKQSKKRLQDNIKILQKISVSSVDKVLHPNKEPIASLMEFLRIPEETILAFENQYRTIHLTSWKNTTVTEQFWAEVFQHKDASGENPFQELS